MYSCAVSPNWLSALVVCGSSPVRLSALVIVSLWCYDSVPGMSGRCRAGFCRCAPSRASGSPLRLLLRSALIADHHPCLFALLCGRMTPSCCSPRGLGGFGRACGCRCRLYSLGDYCDEHYVLWCWWVGKSEPRVVQLAVCWLGVFCVGGCVYYLHNNS